MQAGCFSVDTDVFVLGTLPHIPKSVTVNRKKKEKLCMGKSYSKRGPQIADAIIEWYAFKGTGNTVGFASHFKTFVQTDETILDTFAAYRSTTEILDSIFNQMERCVC